MRFRVVGLPPGNNCTVNDGLTDVMCMQAYPRWVIDLEAKAYCVTTDVMKNILYPSQARLKHA